MTCYAIGHMIEVTLGPEIFKYLEVIDETLAPFAGRYPIHWGEKHNLEGQFIGDLIVIDFADLQQAQAWYTSAAYRTILPLRTSHSKTDVFLIEGVRPEHKATDVLSSQNDSS